VEAAHLSNCSAKLNAKKTKHKMSKFPDKCNTSQVQQADSIFIGTEIPTDMSNRPQPDTTHSTGKSKIVNPTVRAWISMILNSSSLGTAGSFKEIANKTAIKPTTKTMPKAVFMTRGKMPLRNSTNPARSFFAIRRVTDCVIPERNPISINP
jgi:hypothetical protein